ncbi:DUF4157 domain-containing protein [Chitiniphilus purpureus]|uniref:DUF4157 domain-containing protein n=1 Tax=Chitiniphilus purpureus TaxID=2981137 RepID=A0ABY6DJY4_9NEIS|nr:DUF4157 domain-containing protein [Chitiniphilus sp. CD1]UXY14674.1 DUF4157 domain-containing protein [Chitiniphilus sp. CD1]
MPRAAPQPVQPARRHAAPVARSTAAPAHPAERNPHWGAWAGAPQAKAVTVGSASSPLEHEADQVAQRLAAGERDLAAGLSNAQAAPARKVTPAPQPAMAEAPLRRQMPADGAIRREALPDAAVPRQQLPQPPLQRQDRTDGMVRRAVEAEDEAGTDAATAATPAAASGLGFTLTDPALLAQLHGPGPGEPLSDAVRAQLEAGLGVPLTAVRLHRDEAAQRLAQALNARAFTYGSDIWLGPGESPDDVALLAHEAAHVVQQGAVLQRLIQRGGTGGPSPAPAPAPAGPPPDPATFNGEQGRLLPDGQTLEFDSIELPIFKVAAHPAPVTCPRNYQRPDEDPEALRNRWKTAHQGAASALLPRLTEKLRQQLHAEPTPGLTYGFAFPISGVGRQRLVIGTLPEIAGELTVPSWDASCTGNTYAIDHAKELQLGGEDTAANMQLVKGFINSQAGFQLRRRLMARAQAHARARGADWSASRVMQEYAMKFNAVAPDNDFRLGRATEERGDIWSARAIGELAHFAVPNLESRYEVADLTRLGSATEIRVFPQRTGWMAKSFGNRPTVLAVERNWLSPFEITAKNMSSAASAAPESTPAGGSDAGAASVLESFTIQLNAAGYPARARVRYQPQPPRTVPITRFPGGSRYAGYVEKSQIVYSAQREGAAGGGAPAAEGGASLGIVGASPVRFNSVELTDQGLAMHGKLLPTLPLLRGADVDISLVRGDLSVSKTFSSGEIHVPPPFEISNCSLTLLLSSERGFGAEGRVDFGIRGVGQGFLGAEATTAGGLRFSGGFDFDARYFDPARIELAYDTETGRLTGRGEIALKPGAVRGVNAARLTVDFSQDSFSAEGTLTPAMRGIREGRVSLRRDENGTLTFGGGLQLSDDIPNVRSGTVNVELTRAPGEEEFHVRANGQVVAGLAGAVITLDVDYRDGAFVVEGRGQYQRGMLSGELQVGATNLPVDAQGNRGTEPTDILTAYGGGAVTVRLAPWLQATGGVRLLPNGEIELTGELALPEALNLFDAREYNRRLFEIALDIPIVGFTVLRQRVGIFATIGGGLDLSAGVGPGQLRQVRLGIVYNPAHEDQTHVTGGAQLHIPAHAGLRLFVSGALGAGIPIVSASLGLEVGGELGLEGAVQAGVDVDWTPTTGLAIDALGEIFVEPKLRVDLTGFARVEADLLLDTIELYNERWRLAGFELGSNLRFGVRLPLHYREGEPFDVSWDNVEFVVPQIDAMQTLRQLVDEVV